MLIIWKEVSWKLKTKEKKFTRNGGGGGSVRDVLFNATFNNISVILWRSVLLLEEVGVPGENHRPVASH